VPAKKAGTLFLYVIAGCGERSNEKLKQAMNSLKEN